MEVTLAKSAGFCFGVKQAMGLVYELIDKYAGTGRGIYTYGPIIHNQEVVKELESRGVYCIDNEDDIRKLPANSILVIRSHGVPENVYEVAAECGVELADATCPFVKKIHNIVRQKGSEGYEIIVTGDALHPEVVGITGWAAGPITVIADEKEAENFIPKTDQPLLLVSQTTFNHNKFQYMVDILQKKGYYVCVMDTICNATSVRQDEARIISQQVDSMIVIGDEKSSNTRKLYEICKECCKDTFYIQTLKDLETANLQSGISVGITAGASTPNNIIQEVFLYVRRKKL